MGWDGTEGGATIQKMLLVKGKRKKKEREKKNLHFCIAERKIIDSVRLLQRTGGRM